MLVVSLGVATGAAALGACGLEVVGDDVLGATPDGTSRSGEDGGKGDAGSSEPAVDDPGTVDGASCSGTLCDGKCVDTATNALHCGGCAKPCAANEVCNSGVCTPPCPAKQVPCNGTCCAGLCAANVCKVPELWLKADEGVTTNPFVWADQSGKGRDVSQAASPMTPTVVQGALAGRPVLRFANGQRLQGPDVQGFQIGKGDLAWFHVSKSSGNASDRNQVFGTIRNGPPFRGMTAGFGPQDRPYGLLREGDGNGKEVFLRGADGSLDWLVVDLRRMNGMAELRRNGTVIASATSNHDVSGGNIMIGTERVDGTEYLTGDVAEILVFRGTFSDAERAAVTKYLADRHQITVP